MAEKEGFEPSIPFWGIHDFQSCALGQLRDFSKCAVRISLLIIHYLEVFVKCKFSKFCKNLLLPAMVLLDKRVDFHYNTMADGVWRSLVSRLVRVQEASGSNPDTPTKIVGIAKAIPTIFIVVRDSNRAVFIFGRFVFQAIIHSR